MKLFVNLYYKLKLNYYIETFQGTSAQFHYLSPQSISNKAECELILTHSGCDVNSKDSNIVVVEVLHPQFRNFVSISIQSCDYLVSISSDVRKEGAEFAPK